jgi:hypothetical protein
MKQKTPHPKLHRAANDSLLESHDPAHGGHTAHNMAYGRLMASEKAPSIAPPLGEKQLGWRAMSRQALLAVRRL